MLLQTRRKPLKLFLLAFGVALIAFSTFSYFPQADQVEEIVLDNGLTLLLKENHTSSIVALEAFVGGGIQAEPEGKAGLAELTQRMLLKGTKNRTEAEIFQQVEGVGARLFQKTWPDFGVVYLLSRKATLDEVLPVWKDVLLYPSFPESSLESTKKHVLDEIEAGRDDKFNEIYRKFKATLYGNKGYGKPMLGYSDTVKSLSREDLMGFYESYYVPNNMVISAVGDFATEEMAKKLRNHFAQLEKGKIPEKANPAQVKLEENEEVTIQRNARVAWSILGYPAPPLSSPDYPKLKLLYTVLGRGMSSRLFEKLRKEKGLVYSTGSIYPSRMNTSNFVNYAVSAPSRAESAKEAVLKVIQEIQEDGVTEKELERGKNYLKGRFLMEHETVQQQAWRLGWYETLGVGYEMDDRYPKLVEGVTTEDLKEVAQDHFDHYVWASLKP